jgi:hypothetical protein
VTVENPEEEEEEEEEESHLLTVRCTNSLAAYCHSLTAYCPTIPRLALVMTNLYPLIMTNSPR